MTDTQRTATEQMVLSDAVDKAVSRLDFRVLAGKSVYFDPQYLDGTVDRGYLISTLRQHLLASGCILQEDRAKATYVVEARSGGVGTDRHSVLLGVPQMTVPSVLPGQPTQIPEIPFARKTDQNGVVKVAVFAYNRQTGQPVWQSGTVTALSSSRDIWLFGAGPFQNGTIRQGTEFAGTPLPVLPLPSFGEKPDAEYPALPVVAVSQAAVWSEPVLPPRHTSASEVRGRISTERPLSATGVIRAYLLETQSPSVPIPMPKLSPVPANAGGQGETQPIKVMSGAQGCKPDS
jgi:hypothetical protein